MRLRTSKLVLLSALATAVFSGCRRSPAEGPVAGSTPAAPVTTPTPDADTVDRLRALGYAGFVPRSDDREGSGVVRYDRSASCPGYTLFVNSPLCSAVLMDEEGRIKNYWSMDKCYRWANPELTEAGDLLVVGRDQTSEEAGLTPSPVADGDTGRRFLLKMSWDGKRIWKRRFPAHHDLTVGPSEQILTLTMRHRLIPEVHATLPIRDHRIALLSPEGIEIQSLSLYDLLHAAPDLLKLQPNVGRHPTAIDLIHANAVEWLPATPLAASNPVFSPGNILVTIRHQDVVVIVDWKARKLVWAWGQGQVSGPHAATMLPNGHILVFDNGLGRGWSRVIELDPVRKAIVWEYRAPVKEDFFTLTRGSNQRLPNGNTLIAQSDRGRAFEVTPAGEIVWEFLTPFRNSRGERSIVVRMRRFDRARIEAIVARRGEGRREAPLAAFRSR